MQRNSPEPFDGSAGKYGPTTRKGVQAPPPCGFFAVDRTGRVTAAGGNGIMFDGRSPAGCVGELLAGLISPKDQEQAMRQIDSAFDSNLALNIDCDHEGRYLMFTLIPVEGEASLAVTMQDLTGCRKAEQENLRDRLFMKAVFESLPGAFTVTDADGSLIRWNACHRDELAGKSDEDLYGTDVLEVVHPDDRANEIEATRKVLLEGQEVCREARVLRRGGPDYGWRQISGRRVVIDGKPFVVGTSIDISSRKRAEEALRQGEERFRTLFHGHSAIMLVFDAESGAIVDANQSAADFYGWTIEELRGMRIHRLNPYPSERQSGYGDPNASGKPNTFTFHHRLKDGTIRQVDISGNRIEIGGAQLIYAIIHDVTDRNRWAALTDYRLRLYQNAEASSCETLLRDALDEAERQTAAPFSFFHFLNGGGEDGQLRVWSSAMKERMSNVRDDYRHRPVEDFNEWIEAVEQRRTVIVEDFSSRMQSGSMPHAHPMISRMMIVPVVRGEEVPAVFVLGNKPYPFEPEDVRRAEAIVDIVWDVVARKRAEQSEIKMQAALMQIQKMELIGQLAGGVAHDFNNMLSVILGNAEIAIEFEEPTGGVLDNLNEILDAAERSAKLTGQLMAFARKQPVMPEVVDLNESVEGIFVMLTRLVGEEVELLWKPADHPPKVRIDPSQIDQILTNLCINARDAIDGTGRITIAIGECRLDHASYERGAFRASGDYIVLKVGDTGVGIPKGNLNHIFEPFFTTKEVGQGSGLGLSTVYGIVKQNGGYIEVDSEPGQGAEFRVFLPRYHAVETQVARVADKPVASHRQGTILLVEDEPEILNICKLMLEKNGYGVLAASTPWDALKLVSAHAGSIDLLLTDVIMTEMNGRDLADQVKAIHPGISVLFMSGYASSVVAEHGVVGEDNFIRKPFSIRDLVAMVRKKLVSN